MEISKQRWDNDERAVWVSRRDFDVNQWMNRQLALSKSTMLSLYLRYFHWWLTQQSLFFFFFWLDPPINSDQITFKIDHADGRQLTLSLTSSTTLKDLLRLVSQRLSLPSVSLVWKNQTLKIDDEHPSITLKQLGFSSDQIQLIESYPLTRKVQLFIQTSTHSAADRRRRSSALSKREFTLLDSEPFEKIFHIYQREMKSQEIRFEFDGETLHPRATPSDFDMNDGDILDAFIPSS